MGITPAAVRLAARRDKAFAEMIRHAEMNRELVHLQQIRAAGGKSWRASAWMLERLSPDDFRLRPPKTLGADDMKNLFAGIGEVIASVIPDGPLRRRVLGRLRTVLGSDRRAKATHPARRKR
ncbi:MAG TPA: hypothetical protein VG713_19375 [Pirellulales bacterium]|nr:hypothetical protein [Pirellulales bacterium]